MKKSGAVLLTIGLATALHNAYMTALLLIWAIRDRYSHGVVVPLESVLIGPLLIPNGRPFFQMVLWSTFPYYTQTTPDGETRSNDQRYFMLFGGWLEP